MRLEEWRAARLELLAKEKELTRHRDVLMGTYTWLDLTALGRQEDEERPPGNGDGRGMGWLRRHDEYGQEP